VVGDFNGDYIPDLAIADSGSNNVTVLLGNGTGGFKNGSGSPFPVGAAPVSLAVGDFASTGAPDLVVANSGEGDVTLLLNTTSSAGATAAVMASAASYSATAPVAPGSLVSIFGTDSDVAGELKAPQYPMTCLGNAAVTLTDFSGAKTLLTLFYIGQAQASYVGPVQINAQIPQSVANGAATFTVSIYSPPTGSAKACASPLAGISQKGSIAVSQVAPALFSANATGKGVAVGYVYDLLTGASNSVFMCPPATGCAAPNAAPNFVTAPIPNVVAGNSVLVLYGTGIENRAALSQVTVTVAGQTLPAFYAGPTPGYPGVDQVYVALPSSLAGSGTVYVTVSIAGTTSNQVTLDLQ